MSSDPMQSAQSAASAMKTIVDLAVDHAEFKQAGTNLAKSARTITALIDNCLLPIAAVNYAFEKGRNYFERQFSEDLSSRIQAIPSENLIAPKPSIAAPILQGLTFAHEEPELKSLFLNLLKSSMDDRTADDSHPAFVEVVKQLTSEEARLLRMILAAKGALPIVEIRAALTSERGYSVIKTNVFETRDSVSGAPVVLPRMSSMIENWSRLGLISVSYFEHLTDDARYNWVDQWPDYTEAQSNGVSIFFEKGVLRVTSFGGEFARAVT